MIFLRYYYRTNLIRNLSENWIFQKKQSELLSYTYQALQPTYGGKKAKNKIVHRYLRSKLLFRAECINYKILQYSGLFAYVITAAGSLLSAKHCQVQDRWKGDDANEKGCYILNHISIN